MDNLNNNIPFGYPFTINAPIPNAPYTSPVVDTLGFNGIIFTFRLIQNRPNTSQWGLTASIQFCADPSFTSNIITGITHGNSFGFLKSNLLARYARLIVYTTLNQNILATMTSIFITCSVTKEFVNTEISGHDLTPFQNEIQVASGVSETIFLPCNPPRIFLTVIPIGGWAVLNIDVSLSLSSGFNPSIINLYAEAGKYQFYILESPIPKMFRINIQPRALGRTVGFGCSWFKG